MDEKIEGTLEKQRHSGSGQEATGDRVEHHGGGRGTHPRREYKPRDVKSLETAGLITDATEAVSNGAIGMMKGAYCL